jgi:ABC-type transport system involved in multi-copper enzyme maturation permease subunit
MSAPAVPTFGPRGLKPYRPLQGFLPAFTWGLRLALGRPRRIVLVALLGGLVGYLVGAFGPNDNHVFALWRDLDVALLRFAVPLVALVLVAGGFQREVTDRTLVFHLVRPISRRTLFLARYFAGVVVAIPVAIVPVWSAIYFSGVSLPPPAWMHVAFAVALGILSTGAIYYLLAAWLRFGTIAGLVYTFVVDAFVQGASGSMQKLSATFYVRSVHHDLTDPVFRERSPDVVRAMDRTQSLRDLTEQALRGRSPIPDADKIDWLATGDALVVLAVLTAALLALGLWIVSRRDYSLKE